MSRRKLPRKVTPKKLRDLLREEKERILQRTAVKRGVRRLSTDELRAFVLREISDPPGYKADHPAFSGEKVNAGELGHRHATSGKQMLTQQELAAAGYDQEWDLEAYEDGFTSASEEGPPAGYRDEDLEDLGERRFRTVNSDELQYIIHSALRGE